ncbi:MAG: hypothetical protein A3J24_00605 [Deltaproteobacteria bacterium RIFCSPLOWO2_02_FULL_53_8]|nr:MAG: hypothetical protein A3J24_00605 [Deltaproteobacteria bacterium RIFCSPLOWO2_02_FULL_53_8]
MKKLLIILAGVFLCGQAYSAPAWYQGKLTRVWSMGSAFVVTMDSVALSDCKYKYAYFHRSVLGEQYYAELYALMLSAYATGGKAGVVIDKQGVDQECRVSSADIRP